MQKGLGIYSKKLISGGGGQLLVIQELEHKKSTVVTLYKTNVEEGMFKIFNYRF